MRCDGLTTVFVCGLVLATAGCADPDRPAVALTTSAQSGPPAPDSASTCVAPATVSPSSVIQVNGASRAGITVGEMARREYPEIFGSTYSEHAGGSLVITLTRCDADVAERLIAATGLPRDLVGVRLVDLTATQVEALFDRIAHHSDISSVHGVRLVSVMLNATTNRVTVGILNLTEEQRTALSAVYDDPHVDIVDVTEDELPRPAILMGRTGS